MCIFSYEYIPIVYASVLFAICIDISFVVGQASDSYAVALLRSISAKLYKILIEILECWNDFKSSITLLRAPDTTMLCGDCMTVGTIFWSTPSQLGKLEGLEPLPGPYDGFIAG